MLAWSSDGQRYLQPSQDLKDQTVQGFAPARKNDPFINNAWLRGTITNELLLSGTVAIGGQ